MRSHHCLESTPVSQCLRPISPPELERAVLTSASLGSGTPLAHQLCPRASETTAKRTPHCGSNGRRRDTPQTRFTGQMPLDNLSLTFKSFLELLPLFQKAHGASSVSTGESMSIPLRGVGRRTVCPLLEAASSLAPRAPQQGGFPVCERKHQPLVKGSVCGAFSHCLRARPSPLQPLPICPLARTAHRKR